MIPAGYIAKRVVKNPEWLKAPVVTDIYSVSGCISENFADYINYWKHNGFWLFDSPDIMLQAAAEHSVDMTDTRLFYYEVFEMEYYEEEGSWKKFEPESAFKINVTPPAVKQLEGFDVVSFAAGTSPGCSPLSCNLLAGEIKTNNHCLMQTLDEAKLLLEQGRFANSEPGPFRIFAVYTTDWD